jgi:hypothetical protein
MPRAMGPTIFAALLACLVAGNASAAAIYKVRLKDGSIAFTDRPPPGATILEKREFEPSPSTPSAPTAPSAEARKREAAAVDERVRRRAQEAEQADAAVAAAERALAKAKDDLEKGREPGEGDFMGTARKGFARHSPAFEERVRALEQAVAEAQARLARAIEARDAPR